MRFLVMAACALLACDTQLSRERAQSTSGSDASTMDAAKLGRPAFCDRPDARERATDLDALFCAQSGPPAITSLRDLQQLLELVPYESAADGGEYKFVNEVVMLGHSTALSGHLVSPINPRAFILGRDSILAYVRGAQEVELASRARDGSEQFVFYLLRYQQACNYTSDGCSYGELYTESTERDWSELKLQDETELENTALDCRACHARGAERTVLLMREVDGPWTHFFDALPPSLGGSGSPELTGYALVQDYLAAKGDERYAEVDVTRLRPSSAQALEIAVGLQQPLYFDALRIEAERWPRARDGYASEPERSPTWEAAYAAFKRGEQLALPHYDPRPTAPEKQARLTEAYARYRQSQLDPSELPDLSDIFPDDPMQRAEIGLEVERDAAPAQALIQACGPCHNAVLNQALSRARFSIDLENMPPDELDVAIERIALPRTAAGAMPPLQARALPAEVRGRVLDYLRGEARSEVVDPQLARAAQLGMQNGSRPDRR